MSLCGGACAVCYAVGAFFLLSLAVRVLKAVYAAYLRPAEDPKKYGAWAVVTGATDGIGLEYAKQLAAKGMNIVLISRTASKLADVKKEILAADKRDIEVKVIVEDMSGEPTEVYPRIAKQLEGLDIGVLVNNVGISYEHPEFFAALDQERIDALVRLNIVSINQMTRIVLPGMQQRKRGAIVNVSSGSGTLPTALLTAYSATKAYVDFFSRGLAVEVEKDGVFVQSLVPLLVVSKLSKIRKPSLFIPTPKAFVKSALRTLGYDRYTAGYPFHNLQLAVSEFLPTFVIESVLLKSHLAIRKRALRKLEKGK